MMMMFDPGGVLVATPVLAGEFHDFVLRDTVSSLFDRENELDPRYEQNIIVCAYSVTCCILPTNLF